MTRRHVGYTAFTVRYMCVAYASGGKNWRRACSRHTTLGLFPPVHAVAVSCRRQDVVRHVGAVRRRVRNWI